MIFSRGGSTAAFLSFFVRNRRHFIILDAPESVKRHGSSAFLPSAASLYDVRCPFRSSGGIPDA